MKKTVLIFTFLLTPFVTPTIAVAESDPIYTKWLSNEAIGGFDVVSFYAGKPLEGKDQFMINHQGAEWRFSTRANLDLFKTNPEAFIPQYGGYCAWAIARGKLAKGSPENWHVRDGKLYLNFNDRIQNQWELDIPGFIARADRNWPEILED